MKKKSKYHRYYFLVATSQVRTSSSIKSSFSFHSNERALVPQQERWFFRRSRLALCNNPIDALIWWAISAQYTSSSIIFCTLASVPIAFLILSWILSFEWIILKIHIENPYDFSILDLLFSESTSRIRGILCAYFPQAHPVPQEQVSQVHGLQVHFSVFIINNFIYLTIGYGYTIEKKKKVNKKRTILSSFYTIFLSYFSDPLYAIKKYFYTFHP